MMVKKDGNKYLFFFKLKKLQKTKGRPATEIPICGLYAKVAHSSPNVTISHFLIFKWAEKRRTIPKNALIVMINLLIQKAVKGGNQKYKTASMFNPEGYENRGVSVTNPSTKTSGPE
jgi:hypothetical protein